MLELHIQAMSCGHCVSKVTRALKELDADTRIEVDLERRVVRVSSAASDEEVYGTLVEAGYPASPQSASAK